MKISVIIPVLNEASRVALAIDRAWEAGAHEVIASDGGSRDETVDVAHGHKCLLIEGPPGRAGQQNRAALAAVGDVLLFLHADTWLPTGTADQIAEAMLDSDVQSGAFRQRIEAKGVVYRAIERGNALRVRCLGIAYGDQGIFVRREVFRSIGGFPDVPLMEDLRLMRVLRRQGRPALLKGPIHVSPRRWQRYGVLRQTLRNWSLLAAEKCGVSPNRLVRFYPPP